MKTTIIVILLVVVAAAGGYIYKGWSDEKVVNTTTSEQSGKVKGIDDVSSVKSSDVTWKFENAPEDDSGIPSTKVSVQIQQNIYTLGTYQGTCSVRSNLDVFELSGALCWYAGFGDEFGVYKENNRIIIKHRQVDEGTAETGVQKGNFEALLTL